MIYTLDNLRFGHKKYNLTQGTTSYINTYCLGVCIGKIEYAVNSYSLRTKVAKSISSFNPISSKEFYFSIKEGNYRYSG